MMRASIQLWSRWFGLFAWSAVSVFGCGQRSTSIYTLNQTGAAISSAQCSSIRLSVNESSGQISGSGSNPCYTQTLVGSTSSNGQMSVTLSFIPVASAQSGYGQYGYSMYGGGSNCSYQGVLMVSGNAISGVLNPVSTYGYGCGGSIMINGTRN